MFRQRTNLCFCSRRRAVRAGGVEPPVPSKADGLRPSGLSGAQHPHTRILPRPVARLCPYIRPVARILTCARGRPSPLPRGGRMAHVPRLDSHPPTLRQQAPARPILRSGAPEAAKAASGSRAAFTYVAMTSAHAALRPILRVPELRGQARAQDDEGATASMGKILADRRCRPGFGGHPSRDARPHGRFGRLGGGLVLDGIERHRFLSASPCTSLGRAAQGKV